MRRATTNTPAARLAQARRQSRPSSSAATRTTTNAQPSHHVLTGPVVSRASWVKPRCSPPGMGTEASVAQLPRPSSDHPHGRWSRSRQATAEMAAPPTILDMPRKPPTGRLPRSRATAVTTTTSGNVGTNAVTSAVTSVSPATLATNGRATSPGPGTNGGRPLNRPRSSTTQGIAP